MRSSASEQRVAEQVVTDGYAVLDGFFPRHILEAWRDAFAPLLAEHIRREGAQQNRGSHRHYVTLPFEGLWVEPRLFEDDFILGVVDKLVGADPVMCQLATDTPMRGSEHQAVHRDAPPLFPETGTETPPFQLAVNFPLVDVTLDNGPIEIAKGTHMMPREEALADIESGARHLEPVLMKVGDVMIRDVRGLHRGTPNRTDDPRPMVVICYSRRWLFRPEVQIVIPQAVYDGLSPRARHLLRFNPRVASLSDVPKGEVYQAFAY